VLAVSAALAALEAVVVLEVLAAGWVIEDAGKERVAGP
jgi:hypothetical protein